MDILNISASQWVLNEEEYTNQLLSSGTWKKVPLINVNEIHNFKNGCLVRFRGMVQDMYGPEYYMEKYDVVNELTNEISTRNGKYCEVSIANNSSKSIKLDTSTKQPNERHKFVVVSVPGLNNWVIEQESALFKIDRQQASSFKESPMNQCKRTYDDKSMDVDEQSTTSDPISKRVAFNQPVKTPEASFHVSPEHILNHPLGDKNAKVCHVSVYKEADLLKLNDTCEFVGFLNLSPASDALLLNDDNDVMENRMEIQTHHPPASLVPRIHVVHFKSLKHDNPLVEYDAPEIELSNIKKELLILLTQLLMGDALGAEYLICHLLSEVYMRKDFMALGKFSLNISNIPIILQNFDYVAELYKFLMQLVPKSHYLPLSLQNMNTLSFVPKKDYQCNRLTSGVLQLSRNTVMVLDETKLQEGKLNPSGIDAVKSLANAIKNQKVTYDFNYYPLEYDCDILFLIFSEGKSMLPSDIHIPLQVDHTSLSTFHEILDAARHFLKPELLNSIRVYLTKARLIQYEISEQIQDLVQQEFVDMRQNSKVTVEDLHSLLVLSRLICLSEGKNTLDRDCWKKACNMENERKSRLAQQRTSS